MTAKDALLLQISNLYSFQDAGFTAQDCEGFVPVNRNVISHYLNRLCDEGKLVKENTRPVRFYLVNHAAGLVSANGDADEPFLTLIGSEGSLKEQVNLCRAAVNYPNGGLALLMVGESGVGKSHFANLIHRYAVHQQIIAADTTLIELNCADYANNPELLSATLFGHVKGAFTGAEKEKSGLLDLADGSYLFLDEVHRLSAENQEKLFLFMDKGYFYRLGDNSTRHTTRVRFLFATTENTNDVLLNTFRRRIPCRVVLPAFSERPMTERVALVEGFIRQEAQQLQRAIQVDVTLIQDLIASPARGNVGEVKNRIKVLCARAWSQQKTQTAGPLMLSPPGVDDRESILVAADNGRPLLRMEDVADARRLLREFIDSANLKLFSRKLEQRMQAHYPRTLEPDCDSWLHQRLQQTVTDFAERTGVQISPALRRTLILSVDYALLCTLSEEDIESLHQASLWTAQRAQMLADEFLETLHSQVTAQPLPLLTPLLHTLFHTVVEAEPLIQGVVVAHGNATASSIAGTANKLLGGYYLKAFDMPFSVDTRGIIDLLIRHLDKIKNGSGLVIMVDMGSLNDIYREIKLHLHSDLLVMNNVSTAMALDIAEKIQMRLSMQDIVDSIKGAYEVEARYYEGIGRGNKIVISCISGAGVSQKIKDILQRHLPEASDLDVVTMEYDELKWKLGRADTALNGTKLIITTTDLDAGIIPFVNVQQLLKEKSTQLWQNYFFNLLTPEQLQPLIDDIVKLFTLEGVASHLRFLNPSVVIDEVDQIIKQYELTFTLHFESYVRMTLFMHIAAMIERLMINETFHHRDSHLLASQQQAFLHAQQDIFAPVLKKYRVELSQTESLMLYELIEPWVTF